jgi:hypothetical protein
MNRAVTSWMEIQMVVNAANRRTGRLIGERGEGVISTAIAVLIVSFIGAAMWVAFNAIWTDAESNIQREVGNIGAAGG